MRKYGVSGFGAFEDWTLIMIYLEWIAMVGSGLDNWLI